MTATPDRSVYAGTVAGPSAGGSFVTLTLLLWSDNEKVAVAQRFISYYVDKNDYPSLSGSAEGCPTAAMLHARRFVLNRKPAHPSLIRSRTGSPCSCTITRPGNPRHTP